MNAARQLRPAAVCLVLLAGVAAPARAVDSAKEPWEPLRTSSPDTPEELKALQDRVKKVVDQVTPTVVAVLIGPGAGSGVIVRDDGLVLTAAHVIGNKPGAALKIVLPDGKMVNGKTLGVNPKLDSGMLMITDKPPKDAKWPGAKDGKWPVAEIARSGDLKKGQWVVALGHPGGPKPERRPPVRVGRFENYTKNDQTIRTDCTLVGGDSGGPLFDLTGKVVGIHSRIGLFLENNMHVATEAFKDEWDKLLDGKAVAKADVELGVVIDDTQGESVVVESVVEGSAAAKAGLKAGDVILKFDGERLNAPNDLSQSLLTCEPGQKVKLSVQRGEKTLEIPVTLGKRSKSKD